MGKLDDKVALITGSDSGIGHASAVEFAREGADVIVNYLDDEQGADRMDNGGGGKMIDVTSIHEDIPNAGGADYDCSKGALRMLTRTLALEVAQDTINVNSLAPGMVLTPFNQKAIDDPDFLEQQVQSIPLKRAAEPEEIAKLALFLASSDADYVTGAEYVMDGQLMRSVGRGA